MTTVRWAIWQMVLVVAMAAGAAIALLDGIHTWLPALRFPGLVPLLVVVAADAVITQRVVAHERLSPGEQGALRGVEALLLVVAVRIASLAGEDASLGAVMYGWLRDPLAFLGGAFGLYLLPAFLIWLYTTLASNAVLQFAAEMPAGQRSQPIEEAMFIEERAQRVAGFDRYWIFAATLALAGATAALYGVSVSIALRSWSSARPLVALLAVLGAGLLLHLQGKFTQLVYSWQLDQVNVAPDVARRFRRSSGGFSVAALVIGATLGTLALFAPPPPLVPVLNAILIGATFFLALIMGLFSLILLPIAWLLSFLTGRSAPAPPMIPQLPPVQLPEPPGERPLLPALIFWGCFIILVGMALMRYVRQRGDLRAALKRWRGVGWLITWLEGLWGEARAWGAHASAVVRERLARRRKPPRARPIPITGTRAQLRALYRRLIQAAEQGGMHHTPSQTPYELRTAIGAAVPPTAPDVEALTDVYVMAEYGPAPPPSEDVRRARRAWHRIAGILGRARSGGAARRVRRPRR